MTYDPKKHNRQSTRLKDYNYASPGLYFVTICTQNRECIFGKIRHKKMKLTEWGRIARDEWQNAKTIRDNVSLDRFVIMPNHIHGIVRIVDSSNAVGAYRHTPLRTNNDPGQPSEFKSSSKTLGAIIRGYKSAVTTQITKKCNTPG